MNQTGKIKIKYKWIVINSKEYDGNDSTIYKWTFNKGKNDKEIYIGETKQLAKRVQQYNNPGKGQSTNINLNNKIMKCAKNNIKYKLEKLKISYLKIDNKELSVMKCLSGKKGKFMRRFIENYFVIRTYEVSRKRVINK